MLLFGSLLSISTSAPQELDNSFNHDLLYLDGDIDSLTILPAGQDVPEILVGTFPDSRVQIDAPIVSYTASQSGRELALVTKLADETYEIFWLEDLGVEIVTIGQFPELAQVKISPNGKWLAYREEESEEIFAVKLDDPGEKIIVGACEDVQVYDRTLWCGAFDWSPNSFQLVWPDGRGLWIAQPPNYEKRVADNFVLFNDGEKDVLGNYRLAFWSPNSRYLVLSRSGGIEGTRYTLLDARTGSIANLPRTFQHGDTLPVHINWVDSSHLSVLFGDAFFETGPAVDIWRIEPSSYNLIELEKKVYLDFPCGIVTAAGLNNQAKAFYVIDRVNRDYCETQVANGFYSSSSIMSGYLELTTELSESKYWLPEFLWEPDDQHVVISRQDREEVYSYYVDFLNLEQGTVEDLTPIIGDAEDICCFTWVE